MIADLPDSLRPPVSMISPEVLARIDKVIRGTLHRLLKWLMVGFDSRNLPLIFLLVLEEDVVDVICLDKHLQCSAQAMLPCPPRNARHLQALADKVGVGHPSNLAPQHNQQAQVLLRGFIRIVSGILSMSLQPPLLLPRALAD
jgi:hypothetical protein